MRRTMWTLVLHDGRRLPVRALPALVGSDATCAVRLEHASVRPRHARLLAGAGGGLRLEAIDGALVELDGWALTEGDLHDGDALLVGEVRLVVARGAAPRPLDAPAGTGARPAARAPGAGDAPRAAPPPAGRRRPLPVGRSDDGSPRGLLRADWGQLSGATRALILAAALVAMAAVAWVVQAVVVAAS